MTWFRAKTQTDISVCLCFCSKPGLVPDVVLSRSMRSTLSTQHILPNKASSSCYSMPLTSNKVKWCFPYFRGATNPLLRLILFLKEPSER